jgi:hypothetical protein
MTVLLALAATTIALVGMIVRALLVDEARGRIKRRVIANVETTIASLPEDLQAQWAEEWRAELAATIDMPLAAALFAQGLRRSAAELVEDDTANQLESTQDGSAQNLRIASKVEEGSAKAWRRIIVQWYEQSLIKLAWPMAGTLSLTTVGYMICLVSGNSITSFPIFSGLLLILVFIFDWVVVITLFVRRKKLLTKNKARDSP